MTRKKFFVIYFLLSLIPSFTISVAQAQEKSPENTGNIKITCEDDVSNCEEGSKFMATIVPLATFGGIMAIMITGITSQVTKALKFNDMGINLDSIGSQAKEKIADEGKKKAKEWRPIKKLEEGKAEYERQQSRNRSASFLSSPVGKLLLKPAAKLEQRKERLRKDAEDAGGKLAKAQAATNTKKRNIKNQIIDRLTDNRFKSERNKIASSIKKNQNEIAELQESLQAATQADDKEKVDSLQKDIEAKQQEQTTLLDDQAKNQAEESEYRAAKEAIALDDLLTELTQEDPSQQGYVDAKRAEIAQQEHEIQNLHNDYSAKKTLYDAEKNKNASFGATALRGAAKATARVYQAGWGKVVTAKEIEESGKALASVMGSSVQTVDKAHSLNEDGMWTVQVMLENLYARLIGNRGNPRILNAAHTAKEEWTETDGLMGSKHYAYLLEKAKKELGVEGAEGEEKTRLLAKAEEIAISEFKDWRDLVEEAFEEFGDSSLGEIVMLSRGGVTEAMKSKDHYADHNNWQNRRLKLFGKNGRNAEAARRSITNIGDKQVLTEDRLLYSLNGEIDEETYRKMSDSLDGGQVTSDALGQLLWGEFSHVLYAILHNDSLAAETLLDLGFDPTWLKDNIFGKFDMKTQTGRLEAFDQILDAGVTGKGVIGNKQIFVPEDNELGQYYTAGGKKSIKLKEGADQTSMVASSILRVSRARGSKEHDTADSLIEKALKANPSLAPLKTPPSTPPPATQRRPAAAGRRLAALETEVNGRNVVFGLRDLENGETLINLNGSPKEVEQQFVDLYGEQRLDDLKRRAPADTEDRKKKQENLIKKSVYQGVIAHETAHGLLQKVKGMGVNLTDTDEHELIAAYTRRIQGVATDDESAFLTEFVNTHLDGSKEDQKQIADALTIIPAANDDRPLQTALTSAKKAGVAVKARPMEAEDVQALQEVQNRQTQQDFYRQAVAQPAPSSQPPQFNFSPLEQSLGQVSEALKDFPEELQRSLESGLTSMTNNLKKISAGMTDGLQKVATQIDLSNQMLITTLPNGIKRALASENTVLAANMAYIGFQLDKAQKDTGREGPSLSSSTLSAVLADKSVSAELKNKFVSDYHDLVGPQLTKSGHPGSPGSAQTALAYLHDGQANNHILAGRLASLTANGANEDQKTAFVELFASSQNSMPRAQQIIGSFGQGEDGARAMVQALAIPNNPAAASNQTLKKLIETAGFNLEFNSLFNRTIADLAQAPAT